MAETHSGGGGVLEATPVVHYAMHELGLCRDDHEWVSQCTVALPEEEVMGRELEQGIGLRKL